MDVGRELQENDHYLNRRFLQGKWMFFALGLFFFLIIQDSALEQVEVAIVALIFVNGFLSWRIHRSGRQFTVESYVSIGLDLVFVGILVGHSGGLRSPLILLFPMVLIGVVLWRPSLGTFVAVGLAGHLAFTVGLWIYYGSLQFYSTREFWVVCLLSGGIFAEMLSIIRYIREKNAQMARQTEDLMDLTDDLRRANARLEELAVTDPMTGLYNNRHFHQRLREEMTRAVRHGTPLALIMMDIDYFKHYNDTFGHPEGDELLAALARLLKENVREGDVVCRYGGEEFAVILPQADSQETFLAADRIRNAVEEYPFPGREQQPHGRVTLSAGIAVFPINASTPEELVKRADEALYKAKQQDKNTVQFYYSMIGELREKVRKGEVPLLNTLQTLVTVINAKDRY
ncbi:MAG: GGDEF domain-containing protein, partial [Actinobacteria bacterium]|nr:GGDEF domain-containing protein [Actinomycetota bacterium]